MNDGNRNPFTSSARQPSARAIQRQAAEWLALRQARRLTLAEEADFADWRSRDPRHAALYAEVETAWQAFDRLAEYPHSLDVIPDPDLLARPRRRSRFIAPALMAAAAALAVLAALRVQEAPPGRLPEVEAVAGVEPDLVHLADGSRVEIHPGGEIAERFTAGERRVRLVRGEAYFTVAKNPDRPFVVEANGVTVQAVGTAFNVRLPTDQAAVEVLVTEGVVQITPPIHRVERSNSGFVHASRIVPATVGPPARSAAAVLRAGQRTVISTGGSGAGSEPVVETLAAAEIDRALSWQTGRLILDATPLAEVVERFNRHAAGHRGLPRLTIADPRLHQMKISGRIHTDSIESFVEVLEMNFDVAAERRTPGEIILRRR